MVNNPSLLVFVLNKRIVNQQLLDMEDDYQTFVKINPHLAPKLEEVVDQIFTINNYKCVSFANSKLEQKEDFILHTCSTFDGFAGSPLVCHKHCAMPYFQGIHLGYYEAAGKYFASSVLSNEFKKAFAIAMSLGDTYCDA